MTNAVRLSLLALFVGQKAHAATTQMPDGGNSADPNGWTKRAGACRKDVDGAEAGVNGTDFIKLAKMKNEADGIAHCKTMCEKWEDMKGHTCFGVEIGKQGEDDMDYCEIWITAPAGKSASQDHSCDLYDGSAWTAQVGACRVDAEGQDGGAENTNFIKLDKRKGEKPAHEATDIAACKKACQKWGESHDGQSCYGLEIKTVGENDFDYCEVWIVKPEGLTESSEHTCDMYEKPPDVASKGQGAPMVTTAKPEDDVDAAAKTVVGWMALGLLAVNQM